MRSLLVLIVIVSLLAGCETIGEGMQRPGATDDSRQKAKPKPSADSLLAAGIGQFEEGNFVQAERLLRSSIAAGLSTRARRARAHKYLAFTYCVTNRTVQCREEFSQALRADPSFTLTAAEAGHPTWGPAFRSVSQGR
jgi:Tfp pilus assembly protein PilF